MGDAFDAWWSREGQYLDPDTSDVPWYDKREGLARRAFEAAMAISGNYTADHPIDPRQLTFANGRVVRGHALSVHRANPMSDIGQQEPGADR